MAALRDWEKQQIDSMHLLIDQAAAAIDYFKQNEQELSDKAANVQRVIDKEQLNFRLIVFNLYSVLDYTYYLLYCHYSNKGQPDLSAKSTQCGFPYKAKGVKISDTPSQDTREKFIKEKLEFLWGSKIGKDTHMWKEIGEVLLAVQPKIKVDASGKCSELDISLGEEESFSLLHFYRNCCTHRGLVSFEAKDMIFEIDQATRTLTVVNKQSDREGVFSFDIPKTAYWVQLPEHIVAHRSPDQQMPRMLVEVLQQLFTFTRRVSSKLLFSAFLIPRAADILQSHFSDKIDVNVKPIEGVQNATVRVTIDQEPLDEHFKHEDKSEAVDGACTSLLVALTKRSMYPGRPFQYMYITPHCFDPYPPVLKLEKSSKNNRMLLNELSQCIQNCKDLQFTCDSSEVPRQGNDNPQCFKVSKSVEISCGKSGNRLVKVESGMCEGIGKDKANEEAAKKVMEELAHLGFIQLKD